MKILVDANILTRKQKTGVDYYTRSLIFAAAQAMPEATFILGFYGWSTIKVPANLKNVRLKRIWWLPSKMYGLHRHYLSFLPLELFMPVRADAMIFSDFGCPVTIQKVPKLAVIHDLAYKIFPQYVLPSHARFLEDLVHRSLKQATKLIAISNSTSDDIVRIFDYDATNINVISPAVDLEQYTPTSQQQITTVKQKYGIDGDYLLFLSTLEPRKNVSGIIKAYQQLPSYMQEKYKLVLAGKKGWLDEEIEQLCTKAGDRVLRIGRVDTTDKAALYSGAKLFAFPSSYEGFGMPILEAMACGTPVVTSNVSSMPEVAGDAALTMDPTNTQQISQAFKKILTDKQLAQKLVDAGIKRAAEFTWEKSGKMLADLLRSLIKN